MVDLCYIMYNGYFNKTFKETQELYKTRYRGSFLYIKKEKVGIYIVNMQSLYPVNFLVYFHIGFHLIDLSDIINYIYDHL